MPGNYQYIDHTADVAVKITADSLEELFINAASALINSTAENLKFGNTDSIRINLNEYSAEELLVSFLGELNYFFSARNWLLKSINKIVIEEYENIWQLKTECEGSSDVEFNPRDEIKAVTFHQMEIRFDKGMYETIIVFDI